jgi:hypothetical protein
MNGIARSLAIHKPLLCVATEAHAAGDTRAREFVGSEANTYYVVAGGYEDALLTTGVMRSLLQEFFGKYLNGGGAPHLDVLLRVARR